MKTLRSVFVLAVLACAPAMLWADVEGWGLPAFTKPGKAMTLWATYYYTPVLQARVTGLPLLDATSAPLSGPLSAQEWCEVALEGAAVIREADGSSSAYVMVDSAGPKQADCQPFNQTLPRAVVDDFERQRYARLAYVHGCGVEDRPLIPFRSIAVDPRKIPYGTVLYVPALRGLAFDDPAGGRVRHDGYLFASDTGGAIRGSHIDVFLGNFLTGQPENPFPDLVQSVPEATFLAQVVPAGSAAARTLTAQQDFACR